MIKVKQSNDILYLYLYLAKLKIIASSWVVLKGLFICAAFMALQGKTQYCLATRWSSLLLSCTPPWCLARQSARLGICFKLGSTQLPNIDSEAILASISWTIRNPSSAISSACEYVGPTSHHTHTQFCAILSWVLVEHGLYLEQNLT